MRIKLHFVPQALKNVKNVFEIIHKILQTQSAIPNVYLIYFIKERYIRLLIDSQQTPIVMSLGLQMFTNENMCSLKQDKTCVSFKFMNTIRFFESIISILEKQDTNGITFEVKRQKAENGEDKRLMKIMFQNNQNFFLKLPIQPPKYDQSQLKYHSWICGCIGQFKLLDLILDTSEILCMIRYMTKLKQQSSDTKLILEIDFVNKVYGAYSSDPQCLPSSRGQVKPLNRPQSLNSITYCIQLSHLKLIHEIFKKSSKQLKIVISKSYEFILVFAKQQLFVTHIKMSKWIQLMKYQMQGQVVTKIEAVQDQEGFLSNRETIRYKQNTRQKSKREQRETTSIDERERQKRRQIQRQRQVSGERMGIKSKARSDGFGW